MFLKKEQAFPPLFFESEVFSAEKASTEKERKSKMEKKHRLFLKFNSLPQRGN